MRSPRSWTSSIVGFALALLLASWALAHFVDVLRSNWPWLLGSILLLGGIVIGALIWRRRDWW